MIAEHLDDLAAVTSTKQACALVGARRGHDLPAAPTPRHLARRHQGRRRSTSYHENEIAQSSCAHNGAALAKYWMHNGFLTVNGEKMSKSLGNFFTIHELLDVMHRRRFFVSCFSQQYHRQPQDFTREGLRQSKTML